MKDYYNEGITETLDDPINVEAQKTMDPFSYRERLTMPKLLIQVEIFWETNHGSDKFQVLVTGKTHQHKNSATDISPTQGFKLELFRLWATNFSCQTTHITG